jgi:hypothetical protein
VPPVRRLVPAADVLALSFKHGLTGAEYRVLVGLRPRHPLQPPALSERKAAQMRERIREDERLQRGMAKGVAMACDGRIQRLAEQARRDRGSSLERERQLAVSGSLLGSRRAAAYASRRKASAARLGFASLAAYLRTARSRHRDRAPARHG